MPRWVCGRWGSSWSTADPSPYRLQGYPVVRALDEHRKTIVIDVLRDVDKIAGGIPGWDGSPPAVVLGPGERAEAVVVWRNTYDDLTFPPVEVPYLRIAPLAGRKSQVVAPDHPLDLGSTGRIGVSHWRPDHPVGPGPARPPAATEATPPAPSQAPTDPPPLP